MSGQPPSTDLIVDDEPLTCDMLAGFLSPDGYNVIFAYNGPEALKQVKTHVPDVILLDVMMPRVDGFEVLKTVKRDVILKSIPVVVLTSSRVNSDLDRAYDLGCNSYIVKPVNYDNFLEAVIDIQRYWILVCEIPIK